MGRMLEAFRRSEGELSTSEPVATATCPQPAPEASADEEMPFVEVGGRRKNGESKTPPVESMPRLESPSVWQPSLQVWEPRGVALHSSPEPTPTHARVASELIALHHPEHAVSQQYAALFNQLERETADGAAPLLLITALAAGAGTTTVTLNLAVAGCKNYGKRVCVVDCNDQRPAVAARMGLKAAIGLQDVLWGKVALEQAVHKTLVDGLYILPRGTGEAALGSVEAARWAVEWLRQRFDYVLVDAAPLDGDETLKGILEVTSAVYVVVDTTETSKPEVRNLTRNVARLGSRLGGLIVAH
jgi:Mrp family chromosome partitioning ATPase